MDLQGLKWTKSITRQDGQWAYPEFKVSALFKLAWTNDAGANANKPKKGDLILLRQKGYVTHLIRVLDYKAEQEVEKSDFNIYRIVEVLWAIDFEHLSESAKADKMFCYSEVLKYQGGNVMKLEELETFKKYWDNDDGLGRFQSHIQKLLALL